MWDSTDSDRLKNWLAEILKCDRNQIKISPGKVKRPSYGISGIKAIDRANNIYYNIDFLGYKNYQIQYIITNYSNQKILKEENYLGSANNLVKELNQKLTNIQKK